ncbi:MAG: 1-acyl-sn-glycerol-3-phosphate acyltransferase [Planctomycetaceae bacterium]|nr:1-acyl-sn-glycerol-3-phosphate acyltransferase [Planctomycetaceae bacterium]
MSHTLPVVISLAALTLAAGLVWFALVVRSTSYTVLQTFFWLLAKFYTRIMWRARIVDPFPLDADSNGVVICNHRSSIDPFFIQVSVRRVIRWMVAREYCEHPMFGFFLRIAEVIPVNRGGIDTAATKAAIRIVSEGGVVGMLPEGRINTTEQFMNPVRPGAILVALKARAPIIPCYIEGAPYRGTAWSPFLMRARARVRYGQPIDLSPYYGREKDSQLVRHLLFQCVKAIAELAGRPDYEPQMAGRKWRPDLLDTDGAADEANEFHEADEVDES